MIESKPFFYYQSQHIKRVLVVGLGVSGIAVVDYLKAYALEIDIFDQNLKNVSVIVDYQNFDEINLESYDLIVVAPGIPVNKAPFNQLYHHWHKVVGDIELFALAIASGNDEKNHKQKRQKVIAVTGSNGKSTVVSLLFHVLKSLGMNTALGGNIGTPALSLIDEKVDVYVLEISSFQIDLLKYAQFDVVAVLNLSPDHLDRYADYKAYCDAKLELFARGKYCVMNAKQKDLLNHRVDATFSYFNNEATYVDDDKAIFHHEVFCRQSELILQGKHNLENILAVLVVLEMMASALVYSRQACDFKNTTPVYDGHPSYKEGSQVDSEVEVLLVARGVPSMRGRVLGEGRSLEQTIGLSDSEKAKIKSAIATFNPLAHRCRLVRTFKNILYINDSKATNIASTEAALFGLGNQETKNIIILLGGLAKGADFSELVPVLKTYVRKAVVYGQDRMSIYQAIANEVDCTLCQSFDEAFNAATTLACQNDIVLLSPACASFDGFLSYAHRGEYFEELVNKLR
ncbi:UDP-N-acetylmuramoyl-L-alanine--D-glutamate ligase [Cysteiniphilum sp. QT6929]|uniref:UDP-N-acetylmuramoyl-L-alanine--D-glutamate ligase n=1 Tax=Cysteiniphilum sp. QT6929 TaxID=2975055 RepID=UPI0024B3A6D9|nr:UDP-N-acetylmuramoyl-L-alanine--D-glutamate ligase [Cysteiniphilum sp. QT6929]WHN65385.1 UDP-N-acetylmuramoyl-L-alanine--D-glutamate ligase [Cysteiniphilum sp. QT6929]